MPMDPILRWLRPNLKSGVVILFSMLLLTPVICLNIFEVSLGINSQDDSIFPNEYITRAIGQTWPMFGKDKNHSHMAEPVTKGIYVPTRKWDHWFSSISGNRIDSWATTIGNFTPNIVGAYDRNVKHVVYGENGYIYLSDGGTGEVAWRLNADQSDGNDNDNDTIRTAPTLGYFNDNSLLDIIIGTTDGNLYMYEPEIIYDKDNGYSYSTNNVYSEKVWEVKIGENFTQSSPVIGNLDGDTFPDILVSSGDNLSAISGITGTPLWNRTLPGNLVSSPVIYKDGQKKRVLVNTFRQMDLNYSAWFFDGETGTVLDWIYFDLGITLLNVYLLTSPAVGFLDGVSDTNSDLIICTPSEFMITGITNGRVYVYNQNRTLKWSTAQPRITNITGQIDATPAVGDLDGDGIPEIVIVSYFGLDSIGHITHVYAFHGNNGSLLWEITKDTIGAPQPLFTNERAISSPVLADVNTDGYLDVMFATSPDLYAVSGTNGSTLWDISLPGTGRQLWSTPAAGDIDNDGFLDVVLEGAAISHVIIDLTLSPSDFYLSEENIIENQPVTIHTIVHNNGSATANNVKLSFFDNDTLIGNATANGIPGHGSREILLDWTPTEDGLRKLKVVLDPEGTIEETNELNNEQIMIVNVLPSYPDLTIENVQYYRGDGKEVDNKNTHLIEGEEAQIKIYAGNIGDDEAQNIVIRALDGSSPIGTDKKLSLLDIQETKNVSYTWKNPTSGNHELNFTISLENTGQELNLSNNYHLVQIMVNSKVPANPEFYCKGVVYQPDNITRAAGIDVEFTNNRTGSRITTTTNDTGFYSKDVSTLMGKYQEGDEIRIYATDGENATSIIFRIYSEDRERFDNITLIQVPNYAISISVDDGSKEIVPNGEVQYKLTVTNRGNFENTVNLSLSEIINVDTNQEMENWDASLNQYSLSDIPPKGSKFAILTLESPAKRSEARAKDQVLVAVTAQSIYDSSQMDIVGMTTTVSRIYEFTIQVDKSTYRLNPLENRSVKFDLMVTNVGNDDDTLIFDMTTPSGWVAKFNDSIDLAIDEEKNIELLLTSDEDIPAGLYSFTFNLSSIDKKGNTSKVLTVEILRPDLSFVGNITMTPSIPKLSELITFEAIILNSGTAAIDMFIVELWIKGSIYRSKQIFNLSSGEQIIETFNWTPISIGKYTLEFKLDPYGYLIESDTDNNLQTLDLEFYADLGLLDAPMFSNARPFEGEKVKITVTIENLGNVDINDNFYVDFYDGDPDTGGWLFAQYEVVEEITVGSDIDISLDWTARGAREHTIFIEANTEHDIVEIDYENNIVQKTIIVEKKPSEEEDYSLLIIIIFIIAIILIIFLVITPSKQPLGKEKGKTKPTPKGAGKKEEISAKGKKVKRPKKKPGKRVEVEEEAEVDKEAKPADKVKFKVVDEEELKGVEEAAGVSDEEGAPVEVAEEEKVPITPEPAAGFAEKLRGGISNLVSGRWLPMSKTRSGRDLEEAEEGVETDEEELAVDEETIEEVAELEEVEPEVGEDELAEIEVAEVEVVGGEPVDELEPEEVSELGELDELDLDEETEEEGKKRKKEPGWDYSSWIGIR